MLLFCRDVRRHVRVASSTRYFQLLRISLKSPRNTFKVEVCHPERSRRISQEFVQTVTRSFGFAQDDKLRRHTFLRFGCTLLATGHIEYSMPRLHVTRTCRRTSLQTIQNQNNELFQNYRPETPLVARHILSQHPNVLAKQKLELCWETRLFTRAKSRTEKSSARLLM